MLDDFIVVLDVLMLSEMDWDVLIDIARVKGAYVLEVDWIKLGECVVLVVLFDLNVDFFFL